MTTAEAIEGITDAGNFEVLATRVLRLIDEDCRLVEHFGVNAGGKTISNPVDAFCKVPGSEPPRFVMLAFTTDKRDALERKWLYEHSKAKKPTKATEADDGDLIKAARKAVEVRGDHPNAVFIIWLCTNKRLDDDLMQSVYTQARELQLEVKFLAQSTLRDFLDVNPEGQWLRKEHLGIEADRLSLSLLQHLSRSSVVQFGKEFLLLNPSQFIPTRQHQDLVDCLQNSAFAILLLAGPSGFGKSVLCYQSLQSHVDGGGVGLWISGEVAEQSYNLAEAITKTVQSLHPGIEANAGTVALQLCSISSPLVLVVDDINRSGNPTTTLKKLLAWSKPESNDAKPAKAANCRLMCPVWDLFFRTIERTATALGWVKTSPVHPMEIDDAVLCLGKALGSKAESFSVAELREIATGLRGDPILLAMFGATIPADKSANPKTISENVVEHFVVESVAELATATNLPASDHHEALSRLSECMLRAGVLYPTWNQVTEWMANTSHLLDAIRSLAKQEKLCRIVQRSRVSTFEFRHDRILEFELSRALTGMLQDPAGNEDVLIEPFFIVFLGRAIAKTLLSSDQLGWTTQHVPLALIASIAFFDGTNPSQEQQIVTAASEWLSTSAKDTKAPSAVLSEAADLLEATSSAYVLQVTDGLRNDPALAESRLANGDGEAGIFVFSNRNEFYPSVRAPSVEAVLQRAIRSHQQQIVSTLTNKLTDGSLGPRELAGTLTLSGYIADPSLAGPVRVACQRCGSISEILIPALWAGIRCSGDNPTNNLRLLLDAWAAIPEKEDSHSGSEKMEIADILRRTMRHGISGHVIDYLTEIGRTAETLRHEIAWLLQSVDRPSAVRYVAEVLAGLEHAAKQNGGFHHWSMALRENWDTNGWQDGKRMSDESRGELLQMWQNETEAESLRQSAFETWVRATDDIPQLRVIAPNFIWFHTVLWRRVLLGDIETTGLVLFKLATEDKWFRIIHHVWNKSFLVPTDAALAKLKDSSPADYSGGTSNQHYSLAGLLRDIPVSDAEPLVLKHWEYLQFSPQFIQLALYIGTPALKERAAAAVANCPNASGLFRHIDSFFGYMTVGLEHRLSPRHLEHLVPFIELLPDSALRDMLRFCSTNDLRDWSELHLKPECHRRNTISPTSQAESFHREYFPTDSDLIVELEKLESRPRPEWGIYYWLERFKERIGSIARGWTALIGWYTKSPTEERFKILAHVVQWHGTRIELAALTNLQATHPSSSTLLPLTNARFSVKRRTLS